MSQEIRNKIVLIYIIFSKVIISSGIPEHGAEHDILRPHPSTRCEYWQFMLLPIHQQLVNDARSAGLGGIGLATTGGHFFDHRSSTDGSLALADEGPSLDSCFGHSALI